jgi:quercetin dioxygenase-like cupin family protein
VRNLLIATAATFLSAASSAQAQILTIPTPPSKLANNEWTLAPSELVWTKGFFGDSPHAAIIGNEKKTGLYIYRTLVPKGQRTPVHRHPDLRIVTVVSGTLRVGFTDTFEPNKMTILPAGGVFIEPVGHTHYIWAKEDDVVVQVMGFGPTRMIPYKSSSTNNGPDEPNEVKTNLP